MVLITEGRVRDASGDGKGNFALWAPDAPGLVDLGWLRRGLELAAAVARVLPPIGTGSGFLVGPDLLVTARHLTPSAHSVEGTVVEFGYERDARGRVGEPARFALDPARYRANRELDYAIVGVDGSPGDTFGYLDLRTWRRPSVGDRVIIIQHPHGDPKQMYLGGDVVSSVFGHRLHYKSHTEAGSSGSPVFNGHWELVGMHHAGGDLGASDGRTVLANEGVLIGGILDDALAYLNEAPAASVIRSGDGNG